MVALPAAAVNDARLRLLLFSSLFPNREQPRHGIFVEQRLRHLERDCPVDSRVLAPVPWFPVRGEAFGLYGRYAAVPRHEERDGREVWHPRFLVVPRVSWRVAPWLMYRAALPLARRLARERPFDLVDAHFFYPDGVAAVLLARRLGVPVCITARGSDVTLMPGFASARRWITWAAREADGLICVAGALRERLVGLGVPPERVTVLRNGVDLERFAPVDRAAVRAAMKLEGRVLLSVGNLIELKGHHLTIEALARLPDCTLVVVGEGPDRGALERLAARLGVAGRVRFAGLVAQEALKDYYSAADALVLASSREGWANVLLEAMACGTPVVATAVGGTPEVVTAPEAGRLVEERSARGLGEAIERLLAEPPSREATRRYAERFGWSETSHGQHALFRDMLDARAAR